MALNFSKRPAWVRSAKKAHKFGAVSAVVDGHKFPSRAEARRYQELKVLRAAGQIEDLELQPKFPLVVNGQKVGTYVGDFRYRVKATGASVVEDVKSNPTKTAVYILKRKLVRALHGIEVLEIAPPKF